jgi:hypothetical protein
MTQARGADLDQDFARARRIELDLLHHQRLGHSKRRLGANGVQYGSPDFHDDSPARMSGGITSKAAVNETRLRAVT